MPRERNYVARSPLMRKGGVHIKSKTGSRVRERLKLEDVIDEWYEYPEDFDGRQLNESEGLLNGEPNASHKLY